jgi:hypothetical protein
LLYIIEYIAIQSKLGCMVRIVGRISLIRTGDYSCDHFIAFTKTIGATLGNQIDEQISSRSLKEVADLYLEVSLSEWAHFSRNKSSAAVQFVNSEAPINRDWTGLRVVRAEKSLTGEYRFG